MSTQSPHLPLSPPSTEEVPGSAMQRRSGPGRRAVVVAATGALLIAGAAFVLDGDDEPASAPAPTSNRDYFPAGDAWWEPIPDSARVDPDGEAMSSVLASAPGPASLNVGAFGQPVYEADASTPRYRLTITNAGTEEGDWGQNVLSDVEVPIPDGARPSTGSDGKLLVVDRSAGLVYDLWVARRTADGWEAAWGGLYPLDGDGTSEAVAYGEGPERVPYPEPLSRGTGSGISSLAGVLRTDELLEGEIDHALVFATDRPCGPADTGPHRYPATATDGWVVDEPCLPQGARVQLDPELDLDTLTLTPVERTVAEALQTYGAYLVDKSGNRFALIAEVPSTEEQVRRLSDLGVTGDYHYMPGIPMDRFRVLASWDGS